MKHMAVYEVAFNTYKVIAPGHVYLGDDSIREAIGMGSIVVKALVKDKIKIICIKKNPCAQVTSKFALSEQNYVEWVENAIQSK